jgi:hypothetical protein
MMRQLSIKVYGKGRPKNIHKILQSRIKWTHNEIGIFSYCHANG